MDKHYLQGEEYGFSSSDIDVVLPALENSTKKKFNSSFTAEQRRFESLEKQIHREKQDVTQRLSLEKKYFLRSNLVLKQRRELSSRRTARNIVNELEKPVEEARVDVETQEKHQSGDVSEEKTQLERCPYYFPPLYKNVEKDLKEIQVTTQHQMDLAKKESVDTETVKNCRYLRLSSAQERQFKAKNSISFKSEFEQNSSSESYDN